MYKYKLKTIQQNKVKKKLFESYRKLDLNNFFQLSKKLFIVLKLIK